MFLITILNPTRYKKSNNGRGVILNRISYRCYMKDSEEESGSFQDNTAI